MSVRFAIASGFLPLAVSVAVTWPELVGANWTTTPHDFLGPRLVALHPSLMTVKLGEPDRLMVSAALAEPPLLVKVNSWDTGCPTVTVP
jgi:hypothetical protein